MINFILTVIAVVIGLELRILIDKLIRKYKLIVVKRTIDNENFKNWKKDDFI